MRGRAERIAALGRADTAQSVNGIGGVRGAKSQVAEARFWLVLA
jgi:hypothetical protein